MSFKEELADVIRKAQEEKDRERREARDFEDAWDDLRRRVILEVFADAVAALKEWQIGGRCGLVNGTGVELCAGRESEHSLSFVADIAKRRVTCSSSLDAASETFELGSLTVEVVQAQVKRFVQQVVSAGPRPRGGVAPFTFG